MVTTIDRSTMARRPLVPGRWSRRWSGLASKWCSGSPVTPTSRCSTSCPARRFAMSVSAMNSWPSTRPTATSGWPTVPRSS